MFAPRAGKAWKMKKVLFSVTCCLMLMSLFTGCGRNDGASVNDRTTTTRDTSITSTNRDTSNATTTRDSSNTSTNKDTSSTSTKDTNDLGNNLSDAADDVRDGVSDAVSDITD